MVTFPTELLKSLVAVVEHGGFSQAGEVVGRSQPAMSLQIKRLEALAGGALIQRGRRDIVLTETGRLVLDYAQRILNLNDELGYRLAQSNLSGTVRLGIPNEFAMSYLPQVLAGFTQRYPDVQLEVVSQLSKDLIKAQKALQLDVVIALNAGQKSTQQSGQQSIWTEELVWMQSNDTVFDAQQKIPLVVAPEGCVYRDRMLTTLDQHTTPWRIVYTGTSYGGIRAAVMAGLGVTVIAKRTAPEGLKIVKYSKALPKLKNAQVSMHFLSKKPSESVRRLADFILQSAQK
ncbi:MAG: LysR substrate-binding domain-containing protein [Arenicellales bacterium]